jgi:hypothetical protein
MTTATLALLITLATLIQVATGLIVWLARQRAKHNDPLPTQDVGEQAIKETSTEINQDLTWQGFLPFSVVRRAYENRAEDICSFYLVPSKPTALLLFKPGQFLTIQFKLPNQSGKTKKLQRCYSLSDHPHSEYYRISVKREPHGVVSNYLHDRIRGGYPDG